MTRDRFVLRGEKVTRELQKGRARERQVEYAERLIQTVDGTSSELAGSGQRIAGPIELECVVESPQGVRWSRAVLARELGWLLADLERTTLVTFGDLTLPVYRVRCVSRVPTAKGYRLTLRLYSRQHEFTDASGNPVPLA